MATNPALAGHIRGLREAKAAFEALPQIVRDRLLDAVEMTVTQIAAKAKARIASSPSVRTRALYNSIIWRVTKTNATGRVGVGSGPQARYAHLIEYGTRHANAEPFMTPAFDSEKNPHLKRCRDQGPKIERDAAAIGARTR
jgi:HK97 gp10 family phage protein